MISNVSGARLPVMKCPVACGLVLVFSITTLLAWTPAYAGHPSSLGQRAHRQLEARTSSPFYCPARVTMTIQGVGSWKIQQIKAPRHRRVKRGEQSLRLAVLKGDEVRVRQLAQAFTSQAKNGKGPWAKAEDRIHALQISLDDAALADRPAIIRLLVQYGAKPDFASERLGVPAITVAAKCGNIAAMNALYALGADLSAPINANDVGPNAARTAIEVAVEGRQNAAILWLLHHGVNVCTKREAKRTRSYIAHPLAKGRLDDEVLRALQCTKDATGE